MSETRAIEDLAALIDGGLPTLETTVGIRPLASLAAAVAEHVTVAEPDPQFRARLRTQLMEQVAVARGPRLRPQRRAQPGGWSVGMSVVPACIWSDHTP